MNWRLYKHSDLEMVPLLVHNHSLKAQLTYQLGHREIFDKEVFK